jgi:hypothetical protein
MPFQATSVVFSPQPTVSGVTGKVAGVLGFEPRNGGIKIRCLTTWLYPNGL